MPQKRLLVVDDALMVRRHVSHTLAPAGYAVDEASDGMEALQALKRASYDLVLLDLEMPRIGGVELLRLLHGGAVGPMPPVLVLTSATVKRDDLQRFRELGVVGYLDKEIAAEQLLFRVRAALSGSAATDDPSDETGKSGGPADQPRG